LFLNNCSKANVIHTSVFSIVDQNPISFCMY